MECKIIDIHAHFFPDELAQRAVDNLGNYYGLEMHCNGTFSDLKARAEKAGISRLVVHSTALKANQVEVINTNTAAHTTETIAGFGTLHQDYEGDFERKYSVSKHWG